MSTWRILFLDNADNVERLKGACRDVGYVVVGATTVLMTTLVVVV